MNSAADYSTDVQGKAGDGQGAGLDLVARVEALLFVASEPVSLSQLAASLDVSNREAQKALDELQAAYQRRGIRLQTSRAGVQLTTAPEAAPEIERFLNLEAIASLSRASLEVLAIVAYRQPTTRPEIDAIRGVNSDSSLRTLLRHGLIEELGRSEGPGRPFLYATTAEFLQHFGLSKLEDLPPFEPPVDLDVESPAPPDGHVAPEKDSE